MHRDPAVKRFGPLALCAALVISGCAGGEMTLTEYIDRLNAIIAEAIPLGEALVASPQGAVLAEGAQLTDFTPQDLQIALEAVNEIEVQIREAAEDIDPPEAVTEFHNLYFDTRFSSAREALAIRAATTETWEELSETPEMAAYRRAVAEDQQTCANFQNEMDATEERGAFADTPWIPSEMKEIANALLGCDVYPEHPEDMFRP